MKSVFFVLVSAGCAFGDAGQKPEPDSAPPEDTSVEGPPRVDLGEFTPRNVVVVHVDTLRADTLPAWGSERDTMPELGRRGGWISVQRTVSTASWTGPASASLLTGSPQYVHGIRFYDETGPNDPLAVPSLVPHIAAQGVATALFTGNQVFLQPAWGLSEGFDTTTSVLTEPGNGAGIVTEAVTWIDTLEADARFFVVLQPMDLHSPYRPQTEDQWTWADEAVVPFDADAVGAVQRAQIGEAIEAATDEEAALLIGSVRAVYDEQMLGLDRAIDGLMDALDARGRLDDTLIVITADHGESFHDGPPTLLGHGSFLRHELVDVPLLFWAPGLSEAHVPCLASNMDTLPTVIAAMGLAPAEGIQGVSLLDGCRDHAFSASYAGVAGVETWTWLGVESLDTQVVFDCLEGSVAAFDLVADPRASTEVDVAAVADGDALAQVLSDHSEVVAGALPGLTCVVTH